MKKKITTNHDRGKFVTFREFNLTSQNVTATLALANLTSKSDITNFVKKTDFDNKLKTTSRQ